MTAGPHQFVYREPAWWVHTDQGVVLDGPYRDESAARAGGNDVAARLRAAMRRERYSERQVADRVRALRVSFGTRHWPCGWFEPYEPPGTTNSDTCAAKKQGVQGSPRPR